MHPHLGLASFTGMLFRRYSADLTPVLKYIVHQLYNGQATEIVVLRELIWKMAGIEPLPSLSESQMAAMAGGPALRIEAIASEARGARLDPADAVLKGPLRLGKGLLESSLALPLLIQVAQQRQACVYPTSAGINEICASICMHIIRPVLHSESYLPQEGVFTGFDLPKRPPTSLPLNCQTTIPLTSGELKITMFVHPLSYCDIQLPARRP